MFSAAWSRSLRLLAVLASWLVLSLARPALAQDACSPGDLLLNRAPRASQGATGVEHLTDGWLTLEGHPAMSAEAAQFHGAGSFVEWDLGQVQGLRAGAVQADNNDIYRLLGSLDGEHWEPFWILGQVEGAGLRERATREMNVRARYLRFEAVGGDDVFSVAEVRLYCQVPEPWPPSRVVRRALPPDPVGVRLGQVQNVKLAMGLIALPLLLVVYPRLRRRGLRRAIVGGVIGLSALSWVHFGLFHGTTAIHHYDMFHYFMGTKYFPELGYFELYRCTAAAEREAGRGAEIDRYAFRDLDDNRAYPGTWTLQHEGRCRAEFTPARWKEFRADLEQIRTIFPSDWPLARVFSDHGFNATPVTLGLMRLLTADASPTRDFLTRLAAIDWLALAGVMGVAVWGFGPVPGALAALVIAIGFPWGYHWVGGGLARHVWMLVATGALALLQRRHVAAGFALLTFATLLRLFPALFLGAAGLWLLARWLRTRQLDRVVRHGLAAILVTTVVGVAYGAVANGAESYRGFEQVVERHSATPLGNHMGLAALLSARQGQLTENLRDVTLTDPFEVWSAIQRRNREERRPLQLAVLGAAGVFLLWSIRRGASLTEATALGGPLVFCAIPLTSYDYIWVVLLLPLVAQSKRRLEAWVGFAWVLLLIATSVSDIELQHVANNLACLAFLAWLMRDFGKQLLARPAVAAAEVPVEGALLDVGDAEPAPPAALTS